MLLPSFITTLSLCSSVALASPVDLVKRATPPAQTDATFINTILTRVNGYRAQHAANALTWDATLASTARTAASKCDGQHIANNVYGENIYNFYLIPKTTVPDFTAWAKSGVDWWYSEVSRYNVNNPAPAYHYTQLVWKSSTKIGCAWSANQCGDANGDYYLYCEFSPKGNIAGQFAANVS